MIQSAKRALNKRLKKRARQKVKKEEWRCTKQEVALNREYEHRRIDMWLDKMKEEVERTRREESIKREADLVLSEVTRKKSEAKRTMNLLNTLGKLRNARVQTMENRGERVSQLETASFNQVIEKLKKYWVDQLNGYNLEEHGLRVMLNDAEVVRSDVELSLKKQILQEWDEALFGKRDGATDPEPQNLEQLVAIRYCWDNYLCEDNAILSSSIPLGWVVPTGPSNSDWASLLKK
ncbi:hypothetical protein AAG570_004136 [Ranatra chinensis]|uniref:Programmed cell death protein 7 n=1 Tax=Ranatra chinensis TaxID=642074 RepID=A0ABD0Y301_9HEMI